MSLSKQIRKYVIGRRVKKVLLRPFSTGVEGYPRSYDPLIIFDDGTRMSFVVNETETGEYGIEPVIILAGDE